MKKLALAVSILAISAISASAADMAPRYTKAPVMMADPIYNWSGFYVGGSIGYSERNFDDRYANPFPPTLLPFGASSSGGIYGGHVGAQYQWDRLVLGIEYSYDSHFGGNGFDNTNCGGNFPGYTCRVSSNSVQTLGGRLGWAGVNNWLFYVSGGYAWVDTSASLFTTTTGALYDSTNRTRQDGAYAGAGFDYAIWKGGFADLIVGAEYQHIWIDRSLQPSNVDAFDPAGANARYVKGNEDIVRAKLSVKFNPFGSSVVAKY